MRAWVLTLLFVLQASSWPLLEETVTGSGFVIHSDGYVLTNHHVVAGADQIDLVVPGKGDFIASVVADDDYKDLALLKIGVTNLEALPISESRKVNVLDTVIVLGYPLAPALGADVSASEGQVNAIREEGRTPLLQIDANVNPGNSGGPALNDRGEVIGVMVSKLNASYFLRETGTIPERVNFAIPIDEARGMMAIYCDGRFITYGRGDEGEQIAKDRVEGMVAYEAWEKERMAREAGRGASDTSRPVPEEQKSLLDQHWQQLLLWEDKAEQCLTTTFQSAEVAPQPIGTNFGLSRLPDQSDR